MLLEGGSVSDGAGGTVKVWSVTDLGLRPGILKNHYVTVGKVLAVLASSAYKEVHNLCLASFCELGNNYVIKCEHMTTIVRIH